MKRWHAIPVSIVLTLVGIFLALLHSLGLNSSEHRWQDQLP